MSFSKVFARGDVEIFWREIERGGHFEFFDGNVVRGNAVQILPNFPAKSLSI